LLAADQGNYPIPQIRGNFSVLPALDNFCEIGKKFIDRDQRSCHAPPDNLAVLVDQKIEPLRASVCVIECAKSLNDLSVDIAQKRVFSSD